MSEPRVPASPSATDASIDAAVIAAAPPTARKGGIAGTLVRGTLWSIGLRWGNRLMGMLSTLIVARLLVPADYGIVAMATLVLGLVQTFLDADAATALLRSENPDKALQDSAWTVTFIQSLVIAVVMLVAAPFAAVYFKEPRLTHVLFCYAGLIALIGAQSVAPLLARKNFDFALEVKLMFAGRIASLLLTVCLAYAWRSYWALVLGSIFGSLVTIAGGYLLHPYRPRFTLEKAGTLWHFSQWMLVSGIGAFFAMKADAFMVGRLGTARELGLYNVAAELGAMVTIELGAPLNRALVPVLSTLQGDRPRMRDAVMQTAAAVNTFTIPAGVGLGLVAPLVLAVVLGPQWADAATLLTIFSLMGAVRFLTGAYYTYFLTMGRSRILAMLSWCELSVFVVTASLLWHHGVYGIAGARFVACVIFVLIWLAVGQANGLAIAALARAVARPITGCACMAIALLTLPALFANPAVELVSRIAIAILVYGSVMIALWFAMGRPSGIETRLFAYVRQRLRPPATS